MTSILRARGANGSAHGRFLPRVGTGLKGLWITSGADLNVARRNLVPGGVDATVIGSPTLHAGYTSVKSNMNFFQTDVATIPDTAEFTALVVARTFDTLAAAATRPCFISNFSTADFGNSIFVASSTLLRGGVCYATQSVDQFDLGITDFTAWNLYILTKTAAGHSLHAMSTEQSIFEPNTGTRDLTVAPWLIGSIGSTGNLGTADVAACGIYDRPLDADERVAMYEQIQLAVAPGGVMLP